MYSKSASDFAKVNTENIIFKNHDWDNSLIMGKAYWIPSLSQIPKKSYFNSIAR